MNAEARLFEETPFIIAETACAHDGSLETLLHLIETAKKSKARAVQIQIFSREHLVTPQHPTYELLSKIQLKAEEWKQAAEAVHSSKLHLWCHPYDLPSLELALSLGVEGIKVNSSDLSNPQLLEAIAKTGLPVTLSTGASTKDEISDSVKCFRPGQLVLMHGVQNFPTEISDAWLNRIQLLQNEFHLPVGYQDHTAGGDPLSSVLDCMALALGAVVFEKHMVLSRAAEGTDHEAGLEPEEFLRYCEELHTAATSLGEPGWKPFEEHEKRYRRFQKKTIVASRELAPGETVQPGDFLFLRASEEGIAPSALGEILGKKPTRKIQKFEVIRKEDLR